MRKTVLITGATDGIGLATAQKLVELGHQVLIHGRNSKKLQAAQQTLSSLTDDEAVRSYRADFSSMADVATLAEEIKNNHPKLDALINNAGILKTSNTVTPDGLDVRFAVNTFAPWLLTQRLLPLMDRTGRVINLSSAAQASVDNAALAGKSKLSDFDAYSQSKLALTMWSSQLAHSLKNNGPIVVAINPGSLLATKMVKDAFGSTRAGVEVGVDILIRAVEDKEFADASGKYYDNDEGRFGPPHRDALDPKKNQSIVNTMGDILAQIGVY